mgnify:FL=1
MSGAAPQSQNRRQKGKHRAAPKPTRQPYNWLGAGAITLGLGAAMASGTGLASAKTGTDGSSSSGSTGSTATDSGASTSSTSPNSTKGHKHQPKADSSTTDAGTAGPTSTPTIDKNTKAGKNSKKPTGAAATNGQSATPQIKAKAKPKNQGQPTAATSTALSGPTTIAAAVAPVATQPAASSVKTAAATATAAVSAAGTTTTTTTPTTTAHATSSNPIIAAIQNAVISFLTNASTITQLQANGLTGPTGPSSVLNPVGAFLYGMVRGMADFAGLVPKVGTPTTTSDTVNGTVTGTVGFTVPSGAALTYTVSSNPLFGSVTVHSDGTYSYKSNILGSALSALGLNPTDKFTVTASTGPASTNVTVTVPVFAANDTPSTPTSIGQSSNAVTGVVTGSLSSTAPDGQPVTYSVLTGPLLGTLSVDGATGAYTYTPYTAARIAANPILGVSVVNTDGFTVLATSANGSVSMPGIVTVPIEPAANATPSTPTSINQVANAVTGLVTGTISATDPGGQTLTYSALINPLLGTLNLNSTTGAYTYTPSAIARVAANPILGVSVVNTDVFTVTVTNTAGYTSSAVITVPIEPAANNTPSTPTATNITTDSTTGVVTGTLVSTSPDGGAVTYSVYHLPTQGSITVSGNTFTYTPSLLAQLEASVGLTTDTFAVTATNAAGYTSGLGTVTVTVTPIASVLDIPSSPTSVNQNANSISGVVTGTVSSVDPAGKPLTYTVITGPLLGTLNFNNATGEYTYTPYSGARTAANPILGVSVVNTDTFTVGVSNGTFSSVLPGIVTVPIAPAINDTPTTPTATQNQNIYSGVVTGTLSSTSPDGGTVTYTVTPNLLGNDTTTNSNITLSTSGGVTTYTYTPTTTARVNAKPILSGGLGVTSDSFTITATNAAGFSSSTTVTVPISPSSNDIPTGSVVSHTTSNHKTTGTITGSSPDGSAVTYSAAIKFGSLGSVTINPATGAYTISSAQVIVYVGGTVTFTVTNSSGFSYDFDFAFPA